ncbi:carbohydrate ABC transporter permease [Brachybacterium sp. AOP25-B2-12]|uniref:carbohydrate ABC transporter permease n=1 Tax=Brachybacterium sp. AOP25-B2-12 TaxID=3457710 RepID=UPI0040335EB1
MLVFLLLPILVVLWLSTQSWDLISPARFVGLDNFGAVLGDGRFVRSLGVTALFVVVAIPVQTVLGLVLGAVLSWRLPGTSAFRLVLLLPWVCAPLAIGVVWRWVLAPGNGVVASLLGHRITWLDDPSLILWIVVLVTVWSNVGYVALFYAAGISAIPRETFEAAEIDGASPLRRFVAITVPLVRPTTYFVLITGSIGAFQTFDTAYALAPNGGPERAADLVVGRIYYSAFGSFEFGSAAAASLVLFLLIGGVTLLQHRILGRRTTHELA